MVVKLSLDKGVPQRISYLGKSEAVAGYRCRVINSVQVFSKYTYRNRVGT